MRVTRAGSAPKARSATMGLAGSASTSTTGAKVDVEAEIAQARGIGDAFGVGVGGLAAGADGGGGGARSGGGGKVIPGAALEVAGEDERNARVGLQGGAEGAHAVGVAAAGGDEVAAQGIVVEQGDEVGAEREIGGRGGEDDRHEQLADLFDRGHAREQRPHPTSPFSAREGGGRGGGDRVMMGKGEAHAVALAFGRIGVIGSGEVAGGCNRVWIARRRAVHLCGLECGRGQRIGGASPVRLFRGQACLVPFRLMSGRVAGGRARLSVSLCAQRLS